MNKMPAVSASTQANPLSTCSKQLRLAEPGSTSSRERLQLMGCFNLSTFNGATVQLNKFNKVTTTNSVIWQEDNCIAIGLEATPSVIHRDIGANLSGHGEGGHRVGGK